MTLLGFWLAAGALTAAALALVLRPLLRHDAVVGGPCWTTLTRAAARDQIGALAGQRERGELDAEEHEAALAELLRDLGAGTPPVAPRADPTASCRRARNRRRRGSSHRCSPGSRS